jgi:hypothetical protein
MDATCFNDIVGGGNIRAPDMDRKEIRVNWDHFNGYISNFAFGIPGFRQFSGDFGSFHVSGNSETWKPGN